MNERQLAEASQTIGLMLRAFPSSQSSISADTVRAYAMAVEPLALEAVKRACGAFIRGQVPGHNNDFAPSAPKLAQTAKEFDDRLTFENFETEHEFIEEGSQRWQQLMLKRGVLSSPTFSREGKTGWYFKRDEVREAATVALPPPISAERRKQLLNELANPPKFSAGDPHGDDGDMGQMRSENAA